MNVKVRCVCTKVNFQEQVQAMKYQIKVFDFVFRLGLIISENGSKVF